MHDQPNLGGSGGYSRVMYEALKTTDAEYILFMDDDIEIEPDSILRALAFGRFAKKPTLVGGQMLNLQERSHLHSMGEAVDRHIFMWTSAPNVEYDHDFAKHPLTDRDNSKLLHRRIDVDFNGWWMCLIPRQVAEEMGQPLPLFIKWDDVEYGLRARAAGYPTVTMPGAAIWHMAWSDKDDAIDWQAYFHLRNRLVVAALHSPNDGRPMVVNTVKATLKHLLCLEYSTVAIQNRAIRDFMAGPDGLFDLLPTALGTVHAQRKNFSDAVTVPSSTTLPLASGQDVPAVGEPGNPIAKVVRLVKGVVHNFRPANPAHHERPQLNVPTLDARWFLLSQVDGVTVTTADGRGVVYRKRDPRQALGLLLEALRLRRELAEPVPGAEEGVSSGAPAPDQQGSLGKCLRPLAIPVCARWRARTRFSPSRSAGRRWRSSTPCSRRSGPAPPSWPRPRPCPGSATTRSAGSRSPRWECVLDKPRRREWAAVGVTAFGAHAASVVIKRVVRRRRPHHPSVQVNCTTPSKLSFPSSHATSTTAAAVLLGRLTGLPLPAVLVPPMLLSRLVLGVHYPSDVLAGGALGAASAAAVLAAEKRMPLVQKKDQR